MDAQVFNYIRSCIFFPPSKHNLVLASLFGQDLLALLCTSLAYFSASMPPSDGMTVEVGLITWEKIYKYIKRCVENKS